MAIFGLQPDFKNKLLSQYFGISNPDLTEKEIYLGLGLTQLGAQVNTEDFNEVFGGKPLGNYTRARVVFGKAKDGRISNVNEIVFTTASEAWTEAKSLVEMLGLFTTPDYVDFETNIKYKPEIVIPLTTFLTVDRGETLILAPGSITLSLTDL